MRERISITMKKELLEKVDLFVDGVKIRNRSHAIEVLLERALTKKLPPVYILAGEADKCMRRIEGKPLLQHTLELLSRQGFDEITIAAIGDEIEKYFRDGSGLGLKIRYVKERELSGTANALLSSQALWEGSFVVLYGDNYFDFDLKDIVEFHRNSGRVGTVVLTTSGRPGDYGVIELRGDMVVGFNEKPDDAKSYLVSTGIFLFEPELFDFIGDAISLEREVLARLVRKGVLSGYVADGKWVSGDEYGKESLKR